MTPAMAEPLAPELEDLRGQVEKVIADVRQLTENVSERQFNWRPNPAKWSMAQCLSHLNANAAIVAPQIDESIRRAREKGLLGKGPYRRTFVGGFFVRAVEPPPKQKLKAPKAIVPPASDESPAKIVPEFLAAQDRLLEQIRKANGIDLGRAKVPSPVTNLINLTLQESLALVIAHERRHLWQARQVRNDPNFPAA